MLKIRFSAKLSLRRSVSQKKKNMHRLVTDTVRSRVVCWFLYSQESCLIVYSDWISSAIDLVVRIIYLPPKRPIYTKKTHPLLCHSAHFFQPAAVSCACEFGCAQVVLCACVPRTRFPPQPQVNHPDKKGFSEILENFLTTRHSVFQTLSGFRAYSHSVIKKFKSFRCTLFT